MNTEAAAVLEKLQKTYHVGFAVVGTAVGLRVTVGQGVGSGVGKERINFFL